MTTRHYTPVDPNPVATQGPMALHSASSADLFTGAYTQAISLPLPPARNGFVPSVSLVYNSDAEAGLTGSGWNLPVPYIARDLSFGMPLYRETKASELGPLVYYIGASAGRLCYVSSPKAGVHLFRPELERGDFLRFFLHWEAHSWEVFDTAGDRWVLGASPDSRDSDGTHIFAWYVDTIQDRQSNQITYTYLKQNGVLYPLRIEYDQGAPLPAYPKVEFTWESTAELMVCPPFIDVCIDDHRISYKKGFRADYSRKLRQITVTGYDEDGHAESRSYDIAYEASKSYGRGKKLGGGLIVQASGKASAVPMYSYMGGHNLHVIRPQESAPGHPSPANSFQYFDVQEDFPQRREFSWPHDGAAWKQSLHSTRTVVLWNFPNFTEKQEGTDAETHTMSMLVDMDGDGKLDLLFVGEPEGPFNREAWRFYRNKGGFAFEPTPVTITIPEPRWLPNQKLYKNDISVRGLEETWSISRTYFNFSGTPPNEKLIGRLNTEREDHTVQLIVDMNGDGRADLVYRGVDGHIYVCLSELDGAGWRFGNCQDWGAPGGGIVPGRYLDRYFPGRLWGTDLHIPSRPYGLRHTNTVYDRTGGGDGGVIRQWVDIDLVDMNGDGLPDYVVATPQGLEVFLNEGTCFSSTPYLVTLPIDAYKYTGKPCVSESIGEFSDAYEDVNGNWREMQVSLCKTMALIDLNGDKIPDLVLNEPRVGLSFGIPKDAKAFRYAPGTLSGFDTAHYTTIDLSEVPVMTTLPAGTWTDKNGEEGLFIDMNGDGLKDYVMLGRQDPDKVILYVCYNTGHGFLPGYGWEVTSTVGDWAGSPDVEHLTNADDTFDKTGNGMSYLRRALVDIDGDGAVELINIAADRGGKDYWRIYSRSGPATPLGCMSASHSETGLDLRLSYRATIEDSGSSLPFPKWYLKALQRKDAITQVSLTQEYSPSGAYYDAVRREFSGFARVTVTDPIRRLEYSFWNSKDAANVCKRGQLRKVGVYTSDTPPRLLVEDELEHARITFPGEARQWARLEKVTNRILESNPPITSETAYEYETGVLANLGLLKQVVYNPGTPEERRDAYEYCVVDPGTNPGRALVRTHMLVRKDRDGLHELAKTKYLYDLNDCADGCTGMTKGDLSAMGEWRSGKWAMSSLEYDAIGRLSKIISPDNVTYSYDYYGNTPLLKKRSSFGVPDLSVYYSGYHGLSGKPTKIAGPAYRAGHNPADDSCSEYTFDKYGRVLSAGGTMSRVVAIARGQLSKGPWQNGFVQRKAYHDLASGTSPRFIERQVDPFLGGAITTHNAKPSRFGQLRKWTEYYDGLGSLVLLEERAGRNQFAKLYIDYTPLGQVHKTWARITSSTAGYARYTDDASALQQSYSYEYDTLGRVSKITNPDGTSSRFEFKGNVVTYEDELKHHFEAEMNTYGEVVAKRSWTGGGTVWDPVSGANLPLPLGDVLQSTYEYDAAGQLKKAVDPEKGTYKYEYDLDGSLTRVQSPVSDWLFEYTASGKLWKVNKSSGATVEVKYDVRGRISVLREYPGKGSGAGDYREHRYIYDVSPDPALGSNEEYAGRLAEVQGSTYRVTFGYNGQGAVDRVALYTPTASPQPLMSVDRLYLATGEVLQAHFSSKQTISYEYDDFGRLAVLEAVGLPVHGAQQACLTASIQYNSGGQLEQVEGTLTNPAEEPLQLRAGKPFSFMRKHTYGPNCFVSSIQTQISGQAPWLIQQWYQANGQISRMRDDGLRGTDHTYHYDGSNRLTKGEGYDILEDGTKNPSGQIVFQYHKNSALASVTVPNQFVESYSYDSLKQMLTSRTAPQGSWSYGYDGDGQRYNEKTPSGEIAYKWTGGGNLAQVTDQATGKVVQYEYGTGVGRWLANRSGHKTYYLDMLEFNEAENTYSLHLPLPGGILGTLRTGGPNTCTFMDEHGTATAFTAAGELIEKTEYLPYGKKRVMSGGAGFDFGYAGQRSEELAGLSYFGARYYDTRARQWISADPSLTGAVPGSTIFGLDVLQPFVYASADPISKFDVGGLESNWFMYTEAGLALFGGLPVCSVAMDAGVKSLAHNTSNPAASFAAAGLSLHSAEHAAHIAEYAAEIALRGLEHKVRIGLIGHTLMKILSVKAVAYAAGATSALNALMAMYYGARGVAGLARGVTGLLARVVEGLKATPYQRRLSLFSEWYERGLRTAEDFDLNVTHEGLPGWKATPFGLWYDEQAARDILQEQEGICLVDRSYIERIDPPYYIPNPYRPLSELAKAFEEYVQTRQQNEAAARGSAPGSRPRGGGASSFPNDPSVPYPKGGIGSSGGGSGGDVPPWDSP